MCWFDGVCFKQGLSLFCSFGCYGTHYVDRVGVELTEIRLTRLRSAGTDFDIHVFRLLRHRSVAVQTNYQSVSSNR